MYRSTDICDHDLHDLIKYIFDKNDNASNHLTDYMNNYVTNNSKNDIAIASRPNQLKYISGTDGKFYAVDSLKPLQSVVLQ